MFWFRAAKEAGLARERDSIMTTRYGTTVEGEKTKRRIMQINFELQKLQQEEDEEE